MKKIISIFLAAVITLSFAACNNNDKPNEDKTTEPSTLELNIEELKYNWTSGVLAFQNDKKVTLPCTLTQFLENSELDVKNIDLNTFVLEPDESKRVYAVDDNTLIYVVCENTTDEAIKIGEATVYEYSFNNTNTGNKNVKFANTLTVGVGKADVLEALGEPKKTASDTLYIYSGRNDKRQEVELRINFNSDNIVNSVAFEIDD